MTHHNSAGRVLCILSAGALLLAGVPFAWASESPQSLSAFEEFEWPTEDEALFLTHQMGSDRGKRTGLTDGMRGSMGSLGGAGGGGGGPSLSIVNPMDVLRQRLLLELVRRQMRQSENQKQANRDLLNSVGKRSALGLAPAGADLRGLLLRRHVRSAARGEEEGSPRQQQQQPSSGGAHTDHAQHSRLGTAL